MRARVLVADVLDEAGIERLRSEPDLDVEVRPGLSPEELQELIPAYDGLVVRSATQVTAQVLEAGRRLRVVGRAGVGVDNIDVEAATRLGNPGGQRPRGEHPGRRGARLGAALCRRPLDPPGPRQPHPGPAVGPEAVHGRPAPGEGAGGGGPGPHRLGGGPRARAFGMRVLAYDPFIGPERAEELGVELRELEALFPEVDMLTLHTPLTEQTRHLLDRDAFRRMKRGVILVNTARGGLIDEEALLKALESGQVRAAALDVFEEEPPWNSALLGHPRVVATPPPGRLDGGGPAPRGRMEIAEQVIRALKGEPVAHAVNVAPVPPELARELDRTCGWPRSWASSHRLGVGRRRPPAQGGGGLRGPHRRPGCPAPDQRPAGGAPPARPPGGGQRGERAGAGPPAAAAGERGAGRRRQRPLPDHGAGLE